MICHQIKEVNSGEELQAIFQDDASMEVLMNTGFTSTISIEKKDTIVRYRPVQYPNVFYCCLFLELLFCVLCQLLFTVVKFYDCPSFP